MSGKSNRILKFEYIENGRKKNIKKLLCYPTTSCRLLIGRRGHEIHLKFNLYALNVIEPTIINGGMQPKDIMNGNNRLPMIEPVRPNIISSDTVIVLECC
jgi:hypothetical protein